MSDAWLGGLASSHVSFPHALIRLGLGVRGLSQVLFTHDEEVGGFVCARRYAAERNLFVNKHTPRELEIDIAFGNLHLHRSVRRSRGTGI
jgi:hypothetical protein